MFVASLFTLSLAACPIDDARYTMRHNEHVDVTFQRVRSSASWPSGLIMKVSSRENPNAIAWFIPYQGGSSGVNSLAASSNPDEPNWSPPEQDASRLSADIDYALFDENYDADTQALSQNSSASAHIFIPMLADSLRHLSPPRHFGEVTSQFLDLTECVED